MWNVERLFPKKRHFLGIGATTVYKVEIPRTIIFSSSTFVTLIAHQASWPRNSFVRAKSDVMAKKQFCESKVRLPGQETFLWKPCPMSRQEDSEDLAAV